tara:strand:+ start:792 stop:1310 length:519 start_codon:yes stop_codon:yes gene_type:complete
MDPMESVDGLIAKAEQVATEAHYGQTRWGGQPYITHPKAVADSVLPPLYKVVAWLHDVVEDSEYTLVDLRQEGFPMAIVEAVDCLTRRKDEDESYFDFIMRLRTNVPASLVKIADINHNLRDLNKGSLKDKYELAAYIIVKELESAGINVYDQFSPEAMRLDNQEPKTNESE